MTHGVYLVTGKRAYRGHEPGTQFEARLEPRAEQRAVDRGDIRLLRRVCPTVEAEHITFPDGWITPGASKRMGADRRRPAQQGG